MTCGNASGPVELARLTFVAPDNCSPIISRRRGPGCISGSPGQLAYPGNYELRQVAVVVRPRGWLGSFGSGSSRCRELGAGGVDGPSVAPGTRAPSSVQCWSTTARMPARCGTSALEQANCYRPGRPAPGPGERSRQLAEAPMGTWASEGSSSVEQQALGNFDQATRNWWEGAHRRPGEAWQRRRLLSPRRGPAAPRAALGDT